MARIDPQMRLRLPHDVKAFIVAESKENGSSQNSEIIRCIRVRMKTKGAAEAATSPRHDHSQTVEGKGNDYAD
ncbi:Arc family DNA-binding protein [Devosia sp. RR2S18]|uniref:Arc family DNA-binding protein n=1 Tax=Devosia rhizosphaerae TaxID=3049774 RepID=UPI002541F031|nr:Arc family DNA-binding protein [Devosia sp. RR2S18]WIJ24985.1 Arc family DNA-binding protein [Devosia sp. RR2S18]